MNPLFIGTTGRRIFGIYEPPAPSDAGPRATVLCYPWGEEYTYAHRSMRQLAARLTAAGHHVLRFDYFGTGDSAGEASQLDLAGCESDTEVAIEALRDIAGVPKVALIGLRMGANVAAGVASRLAAAVASLVLWDPIVPAGRDLRSLQMPLPGSRWLVLMTGTPMEFPAAAPAREAPSAGAVPVEFIAAPCPWIESATTTGALPVRVIQRIDQWLR